MALDDILKAVEREAQTIDIVSTIARDPFNPQALESFINYKIETAGWDQAVARNVATAYGKDPSLFRRQAERNASLEQATKLDAVKNNYTQLVTELKDKSLEQFATILPDNNNKKYQVIEQILGKARQEKEPEFYEALRKPLSEIYKDNDWKELFETADIGWVAEFAKFYVKLEQENFKMKNLYDEVIEGEGKKQKKKYVFNPEKARNYILKSTEAIKEKDRTSIYDLAGRIYHSQAKSKS